MPKDISSKRDELSSLVLKIAKDIPSLSFRDKSSDIVQDVIADVLEMLSKGEIPPESKIRDLIDDKMRKGITAGHVFVDYDVDPEKVHQSFDTSNIEETSEQFRSLSRKESKKGSANVETVGAVELAPVAKVVNTPFDARQRAKSALVVMRLLKGVPMKEISVWLYYNVKGYTLEQTAAELGYKSASTVHRILKKLELKLSKCEEPEARAMLQRYLSGTISIGELPRFLAHVSACKSCAVALSIGYLRGIQTDTEFADVLLALSESQPDYVPLRRSIVFTPSMMKGALALLALALICAITVLLPRNRPHRGADATIPPPDTEKTELKDEEKDAIARFRELVKLARSLTRDSLPANLFIGKYFNIYATKPIEVRNSPEPYLNIHFLLEKQSDKKTLIAESSASIHSIVNCDERASTTKEVKVFYGLVQGAGGKMEKGSIEFKIPGREGIFYTTPISINKKEGYIYLRVVTPNPISTSCIVEGDFTIEYSIDGVNETETVQYKYADGDYQLWK